MRAIVLQPLSNPFSATQKTIESDRWMSLYPSGRSASGTVIGARLMSSTGSFGVYSVENYRSQDDSTFQNFVSGCSRYWTYEQFQSGVLVSSGVEQVQMWTGSVGGSWTLHQTLTATVPLTGTRFGYSMAISDDGNTLVIGEPGGIGYEIGYGYSSYAFGGKAHIYKRTSGNWVNVYTRTSDSLCGTSVDVSADGTTVVIGEPFSENPSTLLRDGSICVLTSSGGSYVVYEEIRSPLSDSYPGVVNGYFSPNISGYQEGIPCDYSTGEIVRISKDGNFILAASYTASSSESTILSFSKSAAGYIEKSCLTSSTGNFLFSLNYPISFSINRAGNRISINSAEKQSFVLQGDIHSYFTQSATSSFASSQNVFRIHDSSFDDNDNCIWNESDGYNSSVFIADKYSTYNTFRISNSGSAYIKKAFSGNVVNDPLTSSNLPPSGNKYTAYLAYVTRNGSSPYVTGSLGSASDNPSVIRGPVNTEEKFVSFDGIVGGQLSDDRNPYTRTRELFGKRISYISGGYLLVSNKPGVGTHFVSAELFSIPATVTSQSVYSRRWAYNNNFFNVTLPTNFEDNYQSTYGFLDRENYLISNIYGEATSSAITVAHITASYNKLPTTFQLLNTFTHNDEYLLTASIDPNFTLFEHLAMDSVANYRGNVVAQGTRQIIVGFDSVALQFTPKWQDDRVNFKIAGGQRIDIHRELSRNGGIWGPGALSPVAWWSNSAATEGELSSVLDFSSSSRNAAVHSTTSRRPRGLPQNASHGFRPAIRQDEVSQTYFMATGSLSDWPAFHKDNFTLIFEGVLLGSSAPQALLTTWGGSTSNQNSISIEKGASETLQFYITSQTGGGSVHLNRLTTTGTVRQGDRISLVWRRGGTSSQIYIRRRARFPGDTDQVTTYTDTITGTPHSGDEAGFLTCGSYIGLASGFLSADFSDIIVLNRSISDSELSSYSSWAQSEYDFPWIGYESNQPLLNNVDIGAGAGGGADSRHPNNAGHLKMGNAMWANQRFLTTELGLTGGNVYVATIGDSRMDGYNAVGNSNTARAVCHSLALLSASYSDVVIGPAGAYGTGTFAISGMIERENTRTASKGTSYRTPGTNSIDVYMGPSGSYQNAHIIHFLLGTNDFASGIGPMMFHDSLYERVLTCEYIRSRVMSSSAHSVGISILNEPIQADGASSAQRLVFARNRDYHALIRELRRRGFSVAISNLHDTTYLP